MADNKITLDEMKQIELELMTIIDKICKENNLSYSLMDGSLIGAVRHKGFIPWDDDIDIMMPRPDYEKLKKILLENPIENIKYMSCETQKDFYYPFAKVVSLKTSLKEFCAKEIKDYGVFIDIFPIDGVSNNVILQKIQLFKMKNLRKMIQISFHEKEISKSKFKLLIKNIFSIFIKKIGYKTLVNKANNIMKKYSYEKSDKVTLLYNDIALKKNKIYFKSFFQGQQYTTFETKSFLIINNFDKYLNDLFGDYMKLPSEENRVSNHNFDRLEWKDKVSK